jgi:glutathione S-transferase
MAMKLYAHPASTTCRPVMMFIADHGIAVEQQIVDILAGEQYRPAFAAINPNNLVPVLEDDGFRLTESSAILKYLADKIGSPAYPAALQERARINETMDWFNTNLYRSFGYGLIYAQIFEPYRIPHEEGQRLALEAGKRGAERFLGILDAQIIGPNRRYLCGDALTIADYFASGIVSLGETIGCTYAAYPNLRRWYAAMKDRPNWEPCNATLFAWAASLRGPAYLHV